MSDDEYLSEPGDQPITVEDIARTIEMAEHYNRKSAEFEKLTHDPAVRELMAVMIMAEAESIRAQFPQIDLIATTNGSTQADVIIAMLRRDAATFHRYPYRAGSAYEVDPHEH